MTNSFETNYRNWHQKVSYVKSAVRIAGCAAALWFSTYGLAILAVMFLIAELLGVLEEYI